ncbi:MAG: hypothetical protein KME25_30550 [Symplocastrum torsivum CPER-KK1]|uniref:Uncharacterized protein n=1 Tax=Symplocastrum torsivum CPER-KK1 TaxID=450513 RepID=A0A951UD92_9CYAN|nr:hypothetical protein [Symplocastrum torsivum CPER-KK1]
MTTAKEMNPELVRACTPVFLATIGGVIGLAAVLCPLSDGQRSSGMGLAGTAIAGAAGLAQNTKNEANITGKNAEVRVDNTKQPTHENV